MSHDSSSLPAWFDGLALLSFVVGVGGLIYAALPPTDVALAAWYAVSGFAGGMSLLALSRVLTLLEQIRDAAVIAARAVPAQEEASAMQAPGEAAAG